MRMKTAAAAAATAFALLVGAEAFSSNAKPDVDTHLLASENDAANWASYGRTYSENHYSPLREVTANNIKRLGLAWSADLEVLQRADSQPLAVDGIVYVAAGLSIVQAFDAANGRRLWRYDAQVSKVAGVKLRSSWGIRGLALWKRRVLVATPDGRLLALDARTGKLLWSTQALDRKMDALGGGTITGAPRVFNDKVVIGSAGGDWWSRGALSCFDARTGKLLWRFYTVPGNPAEGFENEAMEMAAKTWSGEWWKYGGGGTVWNAITYDPDLNRIYIGTGNGDPQNWKIRNPKGGDNLFLDSIVALDANTGAYVWHYQLNPNDAWDYDATTDMVLEDLTVDGKTRKVLMQAAKNGFFYVIDRETGAVISAEKFERVSWAERIDLKSGRPVENPGIRYEQGPVLTWPGKLGAHSWQPMSYSPKTRLAYIPTGHSAGIYTSEGIDPATWVLNPKSWNSGMSTQPPPPDLKVPVEEFKGYLQAWDPIRQTAVWKVEMPSVSSGGPMATAGGLVFQGNAGGTFDAYDASTGTKLWSFNARVAVLGAPMSYSAGGRQYITVLSGPPSGTTATPDIAKFGWQFRDHPRRILTFALDAKSVLPATTPPRLGKPLLGNSFEPNPGAATRGATLYGVNCLTCHGVAAVAAGTAPDLRESAIALDRDAFRQFVRSGAESRGMPQFSEMLDDELEAIRQYIRVRAQGGKPAGAATGQPH